MFDNALQGLGTANFEFPIYTKDQRRVEVEPRNLTLLIPETIMPSYMSPEFPKPEPETRNPNPKPETPDPKPETRKPKTENRDPKPKNQNPEPKTRNPTPEARTRVLLTAKPSESNPAVLFQTQNLKTANRNS